MNMKKILMCIVAVICMFSVFACNNDTTNVKKTEICALIKDVKDNVIVVDIVEYVTREDTERVKELKLSELDMPNGYHINNSEIELKEYKLTKDTVYNFIDWKNDFVEKGENREFSTTKKDDFIKYLNTYENSQPQMPFFFDIIDNQVISITEKPMM